tara:strand:+ start:490 stop:1548 length:1059 start_codon:yes stop_codon:yes gene_type:complete
MAKTQVNIGMFERAGRASGQANLSEAGYKAPYDYSKGFTDSMKRASEATAAAKKTADLLKKNPNGVKLPKLTPGTNQQVTDYLISKMPEIKAQSELAQNGTEEEKLNANMYLNNVNLGVQQLNADVEGSVNQRAEYLNIESNKAYSASNTAAQSKNFHGIANGETEGVIKEVDGMPRLMYKNQDGELQLWDSIDSGGAYDNSLYTLLEGDEEGNGIAQDVLKLARKQDVQKDPSLWNRSIKPGIVKQVKKVLKNNPNAAANLMFQETEFAPILNSYLMKEYGYAIPKIEDGELDEESMEYKAAVEELKGDGFEDNTEKFFLEQYSIMLDEKFNEAMGSGDTKSDNTGAQFNE